MPNNPTLDAMRLAVMNKKVQKKSGGGALKTAKELWDIAKGTRSKAAQIQAGLYHPIGGGVKLNTPVPLMEEKTISNPKSPLIPRKIITPEDMVGGVALPFVGDRAAAGRILTEIGGKKLSYPVELQGGPDYMRTHTFPRSPEESSIWASGKNVVKNLSNRSKFAREIAEREMGGKFTGDVYGVYSAMSPTGVDYNTMLTEALLGQIDTSTMSRSAINAFDSVMRKTNKNWAGLEHPAIQEQLLGQDKSAGKARKAFVKNMSMADFQGLGFPDVAAARKAITEPSLLDVPVGSSGYNIGKINVDAPITAEQTLPHWTYPTQMGGEYFGSLDQPVPFRDMWREFTELRRIGKDPEKSDWRSLGMSVPLQKLDQEWLDSIMKAQGKDLPSVGEYKDGGAVKDGKLVDELINEAKKKQEAPVNPFRMPTEKQSQYEKDIRQNMANQQEARERLFSDRIPSSVGEAKDKAIGLLQGAGGALAGYGSQVAGGAGDIASLYQEFKPESFPDLPSKVQALPTTEDIQDLLREHVNPSPEFAAGISGGNAAALIQGAASLPALAKSAAKGATAGSKALANEAAYRIHQAMTTGQGPLAGALAGVAPRQLITYHGTPHRMAPTPKNPLGEFDASKIGTGEGAQAYGHGHYLAESPKVAKSYRDKLSDGFTFPGGTKLDSSALTDMGFKTPQVKAIISSLNFHQGDVAKASQTIRDNASYLRYGSAEQNSLQKAADFVSGIKANELPSSGSLYKVDLPDEQIAKMLDWDKPLSQQPPSLGIPALKALEAQQQSILSQLVPLENAGKQMTPEGNALRAQLDGIAQAVNRYHVGNKTGGDYYTQLALEMGSPKNASEALMQSGVSGIRYLDQGSRASGEGTRNFVVFPGNENMMNIVGREKDGGAIHMTGGGKVGAFKALGEILVGGAKVKVRPPSDNVANVRDANFQYPRTIGNQNVSIGDLRGGVRFDKQETQRVNQLAAKIASPEGYISRIIVDQNNNVIEGQHRLEALRKLGAKEVPVYKIEDLADTMPVAKMESAMQSVGAIHSDHVNQLMKYVLNDIAEHGIEGARQMDAGAFQKYYDAALDAAIPKLPKGQQVVLPATESAANLERLLAASQEKRRMYHGSKEPNITEFKTRKDMTDDSNMTGHYADERDAVFLSPEPDFTNNFSKMGYTDTNQAPTTYPVYVQAKNPFNFDNPEHLKKVKETYLDMYHNPDSDLYDPYMLPSERSMDQHTFNKGVDNLPNNENNWIKIENQKFQDVLKDIGFDSFYTRERGTKNLGVYDPSKIKSAVGNRGTYDTSESDINKAKGGPVSLDAMRLALQNKQVQHKAGGGKMEFLSAIGRGLKGMREPVKPKSITKEGGGNWLAGSVEGAMKPLKGKELSPEDLALARRVVAEYKGGNPDTTAGQMRRLDQYEADAKLNQFIDKQLTRYVKNQMATKEDPIRALAEKGTIHTNIPIQPGGAWVKGRVPAGESDQAKNWDALVDQIPRQAPYREHISFLDYEKNKADNLRRLGGEFAVNNEEALAYDFNRGKSTRDLGFDHLIDELRNATNPASGLPRELLLKPESLSKLSVPQAVERVAKINEWRAAQKAEADIVRARNPATVMHKDYPDKGYSWQELKMPEKAPEGWVDDVTTGGKADLDPNYAYGRKTLEDALKYEGEQMGHCVGGYCPDVIEGRSRIFSLRDAKGQPHVTVEVGKTDPSQKYIENQPFEVQEEFKKRFDNWIYNIDYRPSPEEIRSQTQYLFDDMGISTPERIAQIKGKGNKAPNEEYLPFVQDFVKSGKWSDVGDFHNTGLMRIAPESNEALYLQKQNKPIPEYVSDQEYEEIRRGMADAMRSPYGAADEMKEGGVAHLGAGGAPETPEQELQRFLRMLRINASGGKDQYGSSVGGRFGLNIPVSENVSIEPYVQGFAFKPDSGKLMNGGVGGANLNIRFNNGGKVSQDAMRLAVMNKQLRKHHG